MRALLVAAALTVSGTAAAMDLFVDASNGDDANDGLAWVTPRRTIGSALADASASPEADVVSVAAGTYGERVVVPPGTMLLGGFPSGGGVRDPRVNVTVIDGNQGGAPVVHFPPGSNGCVLEGVTVRGGLGAGVTSGGGILVEDSDPLISDTVVEGNNACHGAGIAVAYSTSTAPARIVGCTIRDNVGVGDRLMYECEFGTRSRGGGVHVTAPANMDVGAILVDTTVVNNDAGLVGGVWFHARGGIEHSVIAGNSPIGIDVADGALRLFDVAVTENFLGGVRVLCGSDVTLQNVTLAGNEGVGMSAAGSEASALTMQDSIAWGNVVSVSWPCQGAGATVTNSIVMGGFAGGVNVIDADPLFVTGPLGSYYLSQVAAGDAVNSPALDAGSVQASLPGLDQRTTRRDRLGDQGTVDLGYHYPAVAAMTVLRGATPTGLVPHRSITALPFVDDPGTLSDPTLPLLFYRIPELAVSIAVDKDVTADAVRLDYIE